MKLVFATALVAAAVALCGAARAVDVFKWKDSQGVVHYGDRPAAAASAVMLSVPGNDMTEEDEEAANERLDRAREKILEPSGDDYPSRLARARPRTASAGGCAEAWRQYDQAAACFSAHRVAGGKGVDAYGSAVCRQVAQPTCAR